MIASTDASGVFCEVCKRVCHCDNVGQMDSSNYGVVSIDANSVAQLTARAIAGSTTQVHLTPGGGLLATHVSTLANGQGCTVHFEGSIGPIPYKGDITVEIDVGKHEIRVKLHLDLPFPFDHEWIYKMHGLAQIPGGGLAVSSLSLDTSRMAAVSINPSLNWWCVLKCGGLGILGILIKCLPSLTGGIPAYVACVTSQAGAGAAGIAVCIAQKCA